MKHKIPIRILSALALAALILAGGCTNASGLWKNVPDVPAGTGASGSAAAEIAEAAPAAPVSEAAGAEEETADSVTSASVRKEKNDSGKETSDRDSAGTSGISDGDLFTERDLAQAADLTGARTLTVTDGETVTITEAGVYVLTGSADGACVVVRAGDEEKVQIVLDGVRIVNTDQPCLRVENAGKVFLTSAEGSENVLSVTGSFREDWDAAIWSRDDLVLNGLGTVTITSTADGIRSNDDLKLTGGTWNVTASDTAMKAHNTLCAAGGTYSLTAGCDGLHAEDTDDTTSGAVRIDGGAFTIRAGDDGIHATTQVLVNGGTADIEAAEGIEATQVILNDGDVRISATDDGINAGRKTSAYSVKAEIHGGTLTIVMGHGDTDAVDSNGDLIITGGTIDITGQSSFDYDGNCTFTGGTVRINGTEADTIPNQVIGGGPGGPNGGWNGPDGGFGGKRH